MTARSGLAERIAYDVLDSPLGPVLAAVTERGVCAMSFEPDEPGWGARTERALAAEVRRYPEALLQLRYELSEYLDGRRRDFTVGLDLTLAGQHRRTLGEITKIRYGATRTTTEIAAALGVDGSEVACALRSNPVEVLVPAHRVSDHRRTDRDEQLRKLEASCRPSITSASTS